MLRLWIAATFLWMISVAVIFKADFAAQTTIVNGRVTVSETSATDVQPEAMTLDQLFNFLDPPKQEPTTSVLESAFKILNDNEDSLFEDPTKILRNPHYNDLNLNQKIALFDKYAADSVLYRFLSNDKIQFEIRKRFGLVYQVPDWGVRLNAIEIMIFPPIGMLLLGLVIFWISAGFIKREAK